jgi:hypothetical protein
VTAALALPVSFLAAAGTLRIGSSATVAVSLALGARLFLAVVAVLAPATRDAKAHILVCRWRFLVDGLAVLVAGGMVEDGFSHGDGQGRVIV